MKIQDFRKAPLYNSNTSLNFAKNTIPLPLQNLKSKIINMKKKTIVTTPQLSLKCILLFLLFIPQLLHAQIEGELVDFVTLAPLPNSDDNKVALLYNDSTVAAEGTLYTKVVYDRHTPAFFVIAPKKGNYILRVIANGYNTYYQNIEVKSPRQKKYLGRILMKVKRPKFDVILNEVEIKGTRLKFYFDKDTLVYNARDFLTQEGMTVGNILRKMPGVELQDDGKIIANGRTVSTLLLNGKDFFNEDRQTILQNLPAFKVREVRVYEKVKDSTSVLKRDREREGVMMDIRLKRQYQTVNVGRVDLAYGTDHRYYTKLLGMRANALSRFSAYAILNNVNKEENIWGPDDFQDTSSPSGDKVSDKVQIDYNLDHARGNYALRGSAKIYYRDDLYKTRSNQQSFYTSGDIFRKEIGDSRNYGFAILTNHNLNFFGNTNYDFTLKPTVLYSRTKVQSNNLSGTFRKDVDDFYDRYSMERKVNPAMDEVFRLYGINHSYTKEKYDRDNLDLSMVVEKDIHWLNHAITFSAEGKYMYLDQNIYQQSNIDYLSNGNISQNDWRNRYHHVKSNAREWNATGKYYVGLANDNRLDFHLKYIYRSSKDNRLYYALNELIGWGPGTQNEMGVLPSTRELEQVIDANNSRNYHHTSHLLATELSYKKSWGERNQRTNLTIQVPLNMNRRSLGFSQIVRDTLVKRTDFVPELTLSLDRYKREQNSSYNFGVSYHVGSALVNLYNLVNISDDSNPLYVTKGNSKLKNTLEHRISGNCYWMPNLISNHSLTISYIVWKNFVAQATLFNKTTGVTTITPQNIDGNRYFDTKLVNDVYLKRNRSTSFHNELQTVWHRSVDFSGATAAEAQAKSVVHNFNLNEDLTYRIVSNSTKLSADLTAYVHYRHSTGNREGFETINSCDYGGRLNVRAELPWGLYVESQTTSVCRTGYNYTAMNDTRFLWDMAVTKRFGEKMELKLEGVDILNQQTNVVRIVNAQALKEEYTNVLNRYAMLHFIWKIN